MIFSSPVEKYYNNKRYQFRNITTDDNKPVIIKIDPKQVTIRQSKYGYAINFHRLADLQAITKVVRNIVDEFNNVKPLITHGRIYFNKVNKDFNALHIRSLCYCNGYHKILVDTVKIE